MRSKNGIAYFIIAIIIAAICCKHSSSDGQSQNSLADSVAVFILQKKALNKEISFPGELLPMERAEIFAKISGYVNSIRVDIGDVVQKGQIVAILDSPEIIADYAQAKSDVQMKRAEYEGSLDSYRRIVNASKVEGTVAAGEFERIKNRMLADSATLEAVNSRLEAYSQLRDYLIIRAPFNGIVTQRNVDPGTLVGSGNIKPLFVIENNNILRLRLPVPEAYTSAIPEDSVVHFTVDAYPGQVYEANLSRKAGALNLNNRTETWEFLYPNKDRHLKSGMYANASIKFGRLSPTFVIPGTAVVTNLERRFVIRLKNNKTEWLDVRYGFAFNDKTEVFGKLSEGDTLLVRGTDEIKPDKKFIPKFQKK